MTCHRISHGQNCSLGWSPEITNSDVVLTWLGLVVLGLCLLCGCTTAHQELEALCAAQCAHNKALAGVFALWRSKRFAVRARVVPNNHLSTANTEQWFWYAWKFKSARKSLLDRGHQQVSEPSEHPNALVENGSHELTTLSYQTCVRTSRHNDPSAYLAKRACAFEACTRLPSSAPGVDL